MDFAAVALGGVVAEPVLEERGARKVERDGLSMVVGDGWREEGGEESRGLL